MTLKQIDDLRGELAEEAWTLYREAFEPLAAQAANRHLMTRAEFDQVMTDSRIEKYLALDDAGALAGMATWTNRLDAVPLVSPAFYERRWPELFAQGRIFYIPFFATSAAGRSSGAFLELFARFHQIADAVDGIVGLDVCTFNEQRHRLPQTIGRVLSGMSGGRSRMECSDAQGFWTYDMRGGALVTPAGLDEYHMEVIA